MATTKIEWADMTINPVVGCSKCSPGCDNCYAERFAARMAKHPNPKISGKYAGVVDERGKWNGEVSALDSSVFDKLPKKSSRIFVGSMTDLFHIHVSLQRMGAILLHIKKYSHHTFMFLTKRPERMNTMLTIFSEWPLSNVWLGVTVCNQQEADEKIPILLSIPAVKRFVSIEPMLGPVDIDACVCSKCGSWEGAKYPRGDVPYCEDCGADPMTSKIGINWVICGGETGPNARPMHPDWVRSLRDQCQAAGVPFFFKGWGEWAFCSSDNGGYLQEGASVADGHWVDHHDWSKTESSYRVGKKRAGRLLDGREWNEFPERVSP